jgi:hypothetical protein
MLKIFKNDEHKDIRILNIKNIWTLGFWLKIMLEKGMIFFSPKFVLK